MTIGHDVSVIVLTMQKYIRSNGRICSCENREWVSNRWQWNTIQNQHLSIPHSSTHFRLSACDVWSLYDISLQCHPVVVHPRLPSKRTQNLKNISENHISLICIKLFSHAVIFYMYLRICALVWQCSNKSVAVIFYLQLWPPVQLKIQIIIIDAN